MNPDSYSKMSVTVPLVFPILVAGEELKEVTVRRPKVKDMLAAESMSGTDGQKAAMMIANLSGLSPKDIHELDGRDYMKLNEVFQGFLS